jgi:hypothetical protein
MIEIGHTYEEVLGPPEDHALGTFSLHLQVLSCRPLNHSPGFVSCLLVSNYTHAVQDTLSRGILCIELRKRAQQSLQRRWPVTCARCDGLVVNIPPLVLLCSNDYQFTQSDEVEGEAWQCLNCGNYIDAVILANRQSPPQPSLEQEAAVSAAMNRVGGLMTGPTAGSALAVRCFTQPTTLRGCETDA